MLKFVSATKDTPIPVANQMQDSCERKLIIMTIELDIAAKLQNLFLHRINIYCLRVMRNR